VVERRVLGSSRLILHNPLGVLDHEHDHDHNHDHAHDHRAGDEVADGAAVVAA